MQRQHTKQNTRNCIDISHETEQEKQEKQGTKHNETEKRTSSQKQTNYERALV